MPNASCNNFSAMAVFLLACTSVMGQPENARLRKADSLFNAKKYTQAYDIYQELFRKGFRSPAMLLRMAYIDEGLQQYPYALYHLNCFYQMQPDAQVRRKIIELAARIQVHGYEMNLADVMINHYRRIREPLLAISLLLAATLMLLLCVVRNPIRKRRITWIQLFVMLIVFSTLYIPPPSFAIVRDEAIAMSGPSAGAEVVGRIPAGERVRIRGKKDVWVKISWKGQPVFIRSGQLLYI
jgi:hypothetical protein